MNLDWAGGIKPAGADDLEGWVGGIQSHAPSGKKDLLGLELAGGMNLDWAGDIESHAPAGEEDLLGLASGMNLDWVGGDEISHYLGDIYIG